MCANLSTDGREGLSREDILAEMRAERARLEAAIGRVPAERLEEPGVEGDWSIKDLMSHIAAWERQMVTWIAEARPDAPPDGLPLSDARIHAMNVAFHAAARDRDLSQCRAEFAASYDAALSFVSAIPEARLLDPDLLPWRKGRPLWFMVGGNTFWHYREHRESIEAWLART